MLGSHAFYCWREDSEIACDTYVLSRLGADHANHYGRLIIKLLEDYSLKNVYGTTLVCLICGTHYCLRRRLADKFQSAGGLIILFTRNDSKSSHFKQDVDKDIADSFNLSLKDLNKMDEKPLLDQQEDPYVSTLLRALFQVRENQGYGGIDPSAYLKPDGKNGYILAKMADGTNYLIFLVISFRIDPHF